MEEEHRIDPEPRWTVAYTMDEPMFLAVYRAARMSQQRDYDSFLLRLGFGFFAHIWLAAGILAFVAWLSNEKWNNSEVSWGVAIGYLVLAAGCGYYLFDHVYFNRARLRRLFRKMPLAGQELVYTLSPTRLAMRHSLGDSSADWSVVRRVTELRDGFVIADGGGAHWLPKDVVDTDFTEVTLAEFLRSKIQDYRVLDRAAGLFGQNTGPAGCP